MIGSGEIVAIAYRRGAEDKPVILQMEGYANARDRAQKAIASGVYARVVVAKVFACFNPTHNPRQP